MSKPWISYVDPATVKDAAMLAEFDRCAREGTPRPESQAIRAHVPAVFWSFANSWRDVFKNGVADHAIKELCRIYVSRSVMCEFCGNQRSMKAASQGHRSRTTISDLINFESSTALRRASEGRAVLRRGDHLGPAGRRQILGAAAQAFQRARTGRDRLFRRADHGPAALAAHAQHRAPPDPCRHRRLDGAGLRERGSAQALEGRRGLLDQDARETAFRGGGVALPVRRAQCFHRAATPAQIRAGTRAAARSRSA